MRSSRIYQLLGALAAVSSLASADLASAAEPYRTSSFGLMAVTFSRENTLRGDFNLGGEASIGVEGSYFSGREDLTDTEIEETGGNSMITRGGELALMVSRYSNANSMSGFYWTMGAGYRQMRLNWRRTPSDGYALKGEQYALATADEDGKYSSEVTSAGVAGHIRGGYRYLAQSVPLSIGISMGLRHFQNKFSDAQNGETYVAAPTTDAERESLRKIYTSALEGGVDIGFAF